MAHFPLFSALTLPLYAFAAGLLLAGCDPASGSEDGARSASNPEDGVAEVGGGFVPSPNCAYDCIEATDRETVCVQTCANDCKTTVLRREDAGGGSIAVTESAHELCPDQLPAPELWLLTCEIMYSASQSDCEETYSAEACLAAFDLCLPPG